MQWQHLRVLANSAVPEEDIVWMSDSGAVCDSALAAKWSRLYLCV